MEKVRLQKYISDCGLMSRRAAEAEIVNGNFTINGIVATLGDKVNEALLTGPREASLLYCHS